MIGRVKPRQIYSNSAREFLKTIDWSCRYLAFSDAPELPALTILQAISSIEIRSSGWRFILLGTVPDYVLKTASKNIVLPSHSGMDLSMQMAIAMEADAFLGTKDKFGVASAIAGRPVAFLEPTKVQAFAAVREASNIRRFDAATVEAVRHEIEILIRPEDQLR